MKELCLSLLYGKKDDEKLLCLCVHRNMNVIIPPHPTPPPHPPPPTPPHWNMKERNLQVIRGFSAQVMSKMCGGNFRRKWTWDLLGPPHPPQPNPKMAGSQPQCARMTALCARMTRFLCAQMTRLQCAQMTRWPPTVDLNRHVDVGDIFILSSLAAILSFWGVTSLLWATLDLCWFALRQGPYQ